MWSPGRSLSLLVRVSAAYRLRSPALTRQSVATSLAELRTGVQWQRRSDACFAPARLPGPGVEPLSQTSVRSHHLDNFAILQSNVSQMAVIKNMPKKRYRVSCNS